MGYYVLKYVGVGPDHFLEHCYDEVVTVRNHIALVKFEHNKNSLLGKQFEEIGHIEDPGDLDKLLGKDDTVELKVRKEEVKTVPIEEILPRGANLSKTKKLSFDILE